MSKIVKKNNVDGIQSNFLPADWSRTKTRLRDKPRSISEAAYLMASWIPSYVMMAYMVF